VIQKLMLALSILSGACLFLANAADSLETKTDSAVTAPAGKEQLVKRDSLGTTVSQEKHADATEVLGIKTKLVGMGSLEAGQVVKGEPRGGVNSLEKIWYQRAYMHIGFNAVINERTKLSIIGESMVHYSWTESKDITDNLRPIYSFYPHDVEGTYSFGNIERPYLTLGFGIFPFKYNPDVRNLGEYLYRTGTYPPTMSSTFDFPLARLTGFKVSSTPIDSLHLCAMLTSESEVIPLQDWGVSFLADYTILKAFTFGTGIFWSHLISVNEYNTTPKTSTNLDADSAYYTFRGTKLMGRIVFDPKAFIPARIFGDNDLRLYSEVAAIGLKDYPPYYKELWRRVPIMVGFNVPAFKVLDVFSVELEWYKWNYPNSYTANIWQNQVPQPDLPYNYDPQQYDPRQNELKWSFYAKKRLGNFSLIGQVAFDHTRLECNGFQNGGTYYGDAMHIHGDWAWMLKTQFDF
jgi:hypothetical protein